MLSYDVILGSVYCVKYKDFETPYSGIVFSEFTNEQIYSYMDSYFNDMLEMITTTDFDVLAHMTCPIRYITGKYGYKDIVAEISKAFLNVKLIIITLGKKDSFAYDCVNATSFSCDAQKVKVASTVGWRETAFPRRFCISICQALTFTIALKRQAG